MLLLPVPAMFLYVLLVEARAVAAASMCLRMLLYGSCMWMAAAMVMLCLNGPTVLCFIFFLAFVVLLFSVLLILVLIAVKPNVKNCDFNSNVHK